MLAIKMIRYKLKLSSTLISLLLASSSNAGDLVTALKAYYDNNYEQAHSLLIEISEDDPRAFLYLGYIYEYGEGRETDLEKALYFYKKAADSGVEEAKSKAAEIEMYN